MEYKAFAFELEEAKAGKDGWEFTGYVSTTSNVDRGNDVVMPGAFDRTLIDRDYRPLLWAHQMIQPPIGVEKSLKVDAKGLLGTWSLLDTQLGSDVYKGLKAKALRRMSMGYQAIEAEYDSDVRKLFDVEVIETSVVPIPMNDMAEIVGVKAHIQPLSLPQLLKAFSAELARQKAAGAAPDAETLELLAALRASADELLSLKVADVEEAKETEEAAEAAVVTTGAHSTLGLLRLRLRRQGILDCAQ